MVEDGEEICAVRGLLVRAPIRNFTTDSFDVVTLFHTASPEFQVNIGIVTGAAG